MPALAPRARAPTAAMLAGYDATGRLTRVVLDCLVLHLDPGAIER
jgi:hypothetical protein